MSGDLAERDADGFFLYRGRADDLLKVGGIYVAPAEIERCLATHPGVVECAVVAADREGLTRSCAWVVIRPGFETTSEALQAFVRERLAPHKVPREVRFVAALPRTGSGKIDRTALRDAAISDTGGGQGGSPGMTRFRASAGFTDRWQHFDFAVADGVATITLARPEKLGALTFDVYADLRDLLAELPHRGDARVLVITGSGRGFCSGGDVVEIIGALQSMQAGDLLEFTRMTGSVVRALRECPLPVIAAVNGIAAGAGAVIALASDFRLLARSARFAFLFTKVGLAGADMGSAYLLPRVIGLGRATELLMLGDTVDSERALQIGLATAVVDDEALPGAAPRARQPPCHRAGARLLDDEGPAHPRARHGSRRCAGARGDDPGAADGQSRPRRVPPRLDRGTRACLGGAMTPKPEIVTAPGLAPPTGFAHAVVAPPGRTVYLGGQTAQAADGAIQGATIVEQFDLAARNLLAALRAAGGEPDDLVSLQVFVTNLAAYRLALRGARYRLAPALRPPLSGDGAHRGHRALRSASARRAGRHRRPGMSTDLRPPLGGATRAARPQRGDRPGHPGADRQDRGARSRQPAAGRRALRERPRAPRFSEPGAIFPFLTSASSVRGSRASRPRPRSRSRSRGSGRTRSSRPGAQRSPTSGCRASSPVRRSRPSR